MEKGLLRTVVTIFFGIIVALLAINILKGILASLMPLLILGGVIYVVYRFSRAKSIPGGRGGILP